MGAKPREAGQYVSRDPIGLAGGTALYGYVTDPNSWIDPFGLETCGSDDAAGGAGAAVKFHKHHTVPREILKLLPKDVAKNCPVRGRAGAPNRWSIPEDLHKAIHKGPGGGAYNEAFEQRLNDLGRKPTVDDVLGIRNDLVDQFGLAGYRP